MFKVEGMRDNPKYTTTTSQLQGYFLWICTTPQQCKVCLEIWRSSLCVIKDYSASLYHI